MKTVREAIEVVEADGWRYIGSKGSHHHFKHETKTGKVTIPGQPKDVVPIGVWNNVKRQAGLPNDLKW